MVKMEVLLALSCVVITIIIYLFYSTKKEKDETISYLKIEKYSLEEKIKNADAKIIELSKLVSDTYHSLEEEVSKNKSLNILTDSLTETLNAISNEKTSLEERLDALKCINESANEKIQELTQQRILAEKTLYEAQLSHLRMEQSIQEEFDSSLLEPQKNFTYIASLMADYLTIGIKKAEEDLKSSDKYHERQRAKKINEIRAETQAILKTYKEAQYQLDYLLTMYPELNDVISNNIVNELSFKEISTNSEIFNDDPVSGYISRSEWEELSTTERNQLALERYLARPKSNWEIGRDYELYIAHIYELKGYSVDTFGSYMRINDLGRDLIAKKGNKIEVIQCKYWSTKKEIHENHICQLFGTVICYCIENNLSLEDVEAVFITSTILSEKAKEFANMLKIKVVENIPLKDFPRIKCNIGHDGFGQTEIYHLPIDPLYDKVKISKKGECYCYSVYEAENLGFRRAYKWHGN